MKNKLILIGVIASLAVIGLSVSACGGGGGSSDPGLTVTRIEVTKGPDKDTYEFDDTALDLAGLEVTAFFSDKTSEVIGVNEYDVSGFIAGKSGDQTITVSYTYKKKTVKDTFVITVMSEYGGIHVLFDDFHDENIVLTGSRETLTIGSNQTLTVTITYDYDEYIWYLNGEYMGTSTNIKTFSVSGEDEPINRVGPFTITAIVKDGDFYYSKNLTFTVVRN